MGIACTPACTGGGQASLLVEKAGSGGRQTWVQVLALPLPCYVTLGKLPQLSEPQGPHL